MDMGSSTFFFSLILRSLVWWQRERLVWRDTQVNVNYHVRFAFWSQQTQFLSNNQLQGSEFCNNILLIKARNSRLVIFQSGVKVIVKKSDCFTKGCNCNIIAFPGETQWVHDTHQRRSVPGFESCSTKALQMDNRHDMAESCGAQ